MSVSDVAASFLAVGDGSVWIDSPGSISEVDPETDKVARTIPLGAATNTPCGIAATADAVWVAIANSDGACDTIGG
jgi:hypothetical protein